MADFRDHRKNQQQRGFQQQRGYSNWQIPQCPLERHPPYSCSEFPSTGSAPKAFLQLFSPSFPLPPRWRSLGFDKSSISGNTATLGLFPPSLGAAAREMIKRHKQQPPTRTGILQGAWGRARNTGKCFNHPERRGMWRWEGEGTFKNHTRAALCSRQHC